MVAFTLALQIGYCFLYVRMEGTCKIKQNVIICIE